MIEKSNAERWWPNIYEPLRHITQRVADLFTPRSEASAMEDCYDIDIELPGVKTENVDVSIHDSNLMVRGEKYEQREENGRTYFFSEREYGAFQRTFRLPADADAEKVEANFSDGVLHLRIAKVQSPETSARKIEVRNA